MESKANKIGPEKTTTNTIHTNESILMKSFERAKEKKSA